MEMTQEEKQAYEWALNQEFNSVAARYARVLAKYIESMEAAQQSMKADGENGEQVEKVPPGGYYYL